MLITEPVVPPEGSFTKRKEAAAESTRSKTAVVYLAGFLGILCLLGSAYILAVEIATPRALWLEEYRLFNPSNADKYVLGPVGLQVANLLPEPGVYGRYADCDAARRRSMAAGNWTAASARAAECLRAIEAALQRMPASTALWFHRARLIAAYGPDDAGVDDSLRMSYRTGAREGWIMPARLLFALRRWEQLPEDLHRTAALDVAVMLQSWNLRRTLARTYWSEPAIRERLAELVEEKATPEQKNDFAWLVRELMRGSDHP
ncbi:MAG: hypothetical protein ACT4SY_15435 [Hyphomicrobiales bacterium]